ncbi:MAG: hypothetical protein ACON4Q_01840 [Candidatus Puniceispirillaceae bacterium]
MLKNMIPASIQHRLQHIQLWHDGMTNKSWLKPLSGRGFMLVAVLAAFCAILANYSVRQNQLSIWQDNPQFFFLGEKPLFSTTDASYFLGKAQALSAGESSISFDYDRLYPNTVVDAPVTAEQESLRSVPLLSVLISAISPSSSSEDILKAGHAMLPLTAALTALAIVFAFGVAGYWLEGAVAAIGGGLSISYLARSSAGRIDTDQLNLFFFYGMIGLVVLSARLRNQWAGIALAAFAGGFAHLFMWWYNKPDFIWAAAIGLMWLNLILHGNLLRLILSLAVFLLISGVSLPNFFPSSYLGDDIVFGQLIFPDTHKTITELSIVPLSKILMNATGHIMLGVFCVIGLGLWALRHPVIAVAYGPLAAFGLLNFLIGNRAIFFSAPILWFGGAWLAITITRYVGVMAEQQFGGEKASETVKRLFGFQWLPATIGGVACLFISWQASPTEYVPRPSFPKPIMAAFEAIDANVQDEQAVVASWWDYGYASMLFNGQPTLHDPGLQTTPTTHLFARAILSPDQFQTAAMLRYLARDGHRGIERDGRDQNSLLNAMRDRLAEPAPDIYLVLTSQMAGWMGSISKLGNWDIDKGQPISVPGNRMGHVLIYDNPRCTRTQQAGVINCNGADINLGKGLLNGQPFFNGLVRTSGGQYRAGQKLLDEGYYVMQIDETDEKTSVQIMHRQLQSSTFNQLMYLGQAREGLFELVYDDFPHARIFRIPGDLQ